MCPQKAPPGPDLRVPEAGGWSPGPAGYLSRSPCLSPSCFSFQRLTQTTCTSRGEPSSPLVHRCQHGPHPVLGTSWALLEARWGPMRACVCWEVSVGPFSAPKGHLCTPHPWALCPPASSQVQLLGIPQRTGQEEREPRPFIPHSLRVGPRGGSFEFPYYNRGSCPVAPPLRLHCSLPSPSGLQGAAKSLRGFPRRSPHSCK